MYQRKGENHCWPHSHGKLLTVTKTWPLGTPWWSSGWDSALPLQGGTSLIPGQGTRILHAMQYSQKKKRLLMNLENTLSKRSQSDKDYVLYESIYIKCPEKANLKRLVVAWNWGAGVVRGMLEKLGRCLLKWV